LLRLPDGKNRCAYFRFINRKTLATAAKPMTAAAMPSPTSSPLTLRAADAAGRGAGAVVAPAGRGAGAGEPVFVGGRVADGAEETVIPPAAVGGRGAGGAGAAAGAGVAPPVAGAAAAGPPAGIVGSLIVGEELGLGGRLMRTVSFLGWTLAASGGLGGTAPPGVIGLLSDIELVNAAKLELAMGSVKLLLNRLRAAEFRLEKFFATATNGP